MNSLLVAAVMIGGFVLAYHTYGKFLAGKLFRVDPNATPPSEALRDDVDYVPTNRHVLFGHHFTSIAGTMPIVGPAIAIIWGWAPAALWVFFGAILIGAFHDLGALLISMRAQGRSIGDVAAEIINPRVRVLFLLIIFFELWLVISLFGLIISILFTMYPQAVIPVWGEVPIALLLGYLIYRRGQNHTVWGIVAVVVMYLTVWIGKENPLVMPALNFDVLKGAQGAFLSFEIPPLTIWIVILLVYSYIASTLPVQKLLQPRDYINGHQLLVALALLGVGVLVARPEFVAPAFNPDPKGAPPIFPFLFVTIACGAVSGFHCLVASGTSSKQCDHESSAQFIGYGGMLLEAALSTLVIVAVGAGLGMGLLLPNGATLVGAEAFNHHYASWQAAVGLPAKLGAFVTGSTNMITQLGLSADIVRVIMAVLLVSFAATTLDTATRIQRYVVSELARSWNIRMLTGKHGATLFAVVTAFLLAFHNSSGKGAMILYPLFGTVNQLLAGLALLVITIYLARRGVNPLYAAVPMVFMIVMTVRALVMLLGGFHASASWLLFWIGLAVFVLQIWMVIESALVLKRAWETRTEEGAH